jgi:hypothetical protein
MTDIPTDETEAADGFELLADGRARLTIEGRVHTLRRPRLGEYKHLRTMMTDGTKIQPDEQLDFLSKWVAEAFATLSDRPLDENPDEWPAWVGTGQYAGQLIEHWRSVPLARGKTTGAVT